MHIISLKLRKLWFKGYELFRNYLNKLRSSGKLFFSTQQAMSDLHMSRKNVLAAVLRLKKTGDLISPAKGLYVIVPPENKIMGSIPAEDLVVIWAKYLKIDYYAGLLTAALYYGASHQKPAAFQVVINKQIKHPLIFGQVHIECIYKKLFKNLPLREIVARSGYLKISSPELAVMDLFLYPSKSGGLNHIATVLAELIVAIDANKIIKLAEDMENIVWLQRFGFILEKVATMDDRATLHTISKLSKYIKMKNPRFVPLAPELPSHGYPRSKKWKIIENSTIESDE